MNKRIKILVLSIMTVATIGLVGCSDKVVNDSGKNNTQQNQTQNMSKDEYEKYVIGRYDYYFDSNKVDKGYDIYDVYDDDFTYNGTYNEFVVGYNDFYTKDRANLESFKKDIQDNYKKGNAEVDKVYNDVMTSIDKSIASMDEYGASFAEKTKDYGTLAKDEVIKGLKDIGRVPHEARLELDRMIESAKDRLNID
ncbi:MAG: hypothetical protein ACRC7N_02060 [Clostridium sp.]